MIRFLAAFVLSVSVLHCFPQRKDDKYPSKQEIIYYNNHPYREFEPIEVSLIKNLKYDYLTLRKEDTHNKFISVWESTSFNKLYDSLQKNCVEDFNKKYPPSRMGNWSLEKWMRREDSLKKAGVVEIDRRNNPEYQRTERKYVKCFDSIDHLRHTKKIAEVPQTQILRNDRVNTKRILFYREHGMTEFEPSYWVAISIDNGITWKKYFTGLIENNFYYIKPNPKICLFKNDSTIQFEIAIVSMTKQWGRPIGLPEYELIEDDLVLELNLNKLTLDSDHDGLTDLVEKRLATNPFSKDTDGDGMEDDVDNNPRFKNLKNKYSNLYRFLLEQADAKDSIFIPFGNFKFRKNDRVKKFNYFIVTDDTALQNLTETENRYIFFSNEEFDSYSKQNFGSPKMISVSPLFEVDGKPGVWKLYISFGFYGQDYLIIEKENGWLVKMIGSWIT